MSDEKAPGKIVTFYSYKGGTGRSMALANVAWVLASRGKRVLMLDWDLEAPGLHRYFYPFLLDRDLRSTEGLIDFFRDFVLEAATQRPDASPQWYLEYANILEYAISIEWKHFGSGRLDLVPAGRQGPSYSTRVNSFDWQGFYDRLGGGLFLEEVKQILRRKYDYILIDSRTGVSDTAGICTVQMPDILVVCFTLNNQSIDGAAAVTESVFRQRRGDVAILPVPTRVDPGEDDRRKVRLDYAQSRFADFQVDESGGSSRSEYWARAPFYYIPVYAYEEILSPFIDTPGSSLTVLQPAEFLAHSITRGQVASLDPSSVVDAPRVLAQYREVASVTRDSDVELVRTAEALLSSRSPVESDGFRRLLVRLVEPARPGTGDPPKRARIAISELDPPQAELCRVLASAGVVETDTSSADGSIRLTREWLATGWPRLRDWVDGDREFLLWLSTLRKALAAWRGARRAPEALLRDLSLSEAEQWLARRRADLSAPEQEFIEASATTQEQELAQVAARITAEWRPDERDTARRVLPRLVRVAPVRSAADLHTQAALPDAPATLPLDEVTAAAPDMVLDLLDARVLVKEVDSMTGRQVIRLARPGLIENWSELREWVEADREFLLWQEELRSREERWRESRFSPERLLSGSDAAALDRWRHRFDELPPRLRLYLDASEEAHRKELAQAAQRAVSVLTAAQLDALRPILVQASTRPGESVRLDPEPSPETRAALATVAQLGAAELTQNRDGSVGVVIGAPALASRWLVLLDLIPAAAPAAAGNDDAGGAQRDEVDTVEPSTSPPAHVIGRAMSWGPPALPRSRVTGRLMSRVPGALLAVLVGFALAQLAAEATGGWVGNRFMPASRGAAADTRRSAEFLNLQGLVAYEKGDFVDATVLFGDASARDTSFLPARLNRGSALLRSGEHEEAIKALSDAAARNPESSAALLRLGIAYYAAGDDPRAEEVLRRAASGDSASAIIDTYLGMVYERTARPELAEESYRRALERDPAYEPARARLARLTAPLAPPADTMEAPSLARRTGRVFLQHAAPGDSLFVAELGGRLDNRGFCLPEPSELRPDGPSVASVRYYFAADSATAADVMTIVRYSLGLRSFPTAVELERQPAEQARRVRPGTIEVWLPPLPRASTVRSRAWPTRRC